VWVLANTPLLSPPAASHTTGVTKFYIFLTLFWGLFLASVGFKTAEYVPSHKWAAASVAFMGLVLFIASCVGMLSAIGSKTTRMLLFYTSLQQIVAIVLSLVSGACFFYRTQAELYVETNWFSSVETGWPNAYTGTLANAFVGQNQQKAADNVKQYLTMTAIAGWMVCLLLIGCNKHVAEVVNAKRAAVNLLETVNICLLPVGLIAIIGGQYIADTVTLASAPMTSFAMCVSGVLLMALSFVGCFGTAVDSRGVLRIYAWLCFVLACFLVAVGIVSSSLSEKVQDEILKNWDQIRVVLPPNFEGKYDQDRFLLYVEANLSFMAYSCIVFGTVLGLVAYGAMVLRLRLRQNKQELDHLTDVAGPSPNARAPPLGHDVESQRSAKNLLKAQWKEKYREGSGRQRKYVKIGGFLCCLVLLVIIAVMVVSLVFTTGCSHLDRVTLTEQVTMQQDKISIQNGYKQGECFVSESSTLGSVGVREMALRESYVDSSVSCAGFTSDADEPKGTWQSCSAKADVATFMIQPAEPAKIMGFDVTCQLGEIDVKLPTNATFYRGASVKKVLFSDRKCSTTLSTSQEAILTPQSSCIRSWTNSSRWLRAQDCSVKASLESSMSFVGEYSDSRCQIPVTVATDHMLKLDKCYAIPAVAGDPVDAPRTVMYVGSCSPLAAVASIYRPQLDLTTRSAVTVKPKVAVWIPFHNLTMTTDIGDLEVHQAQAGPGGMNLYSHSGNVLLKNSVVEGATASVGFTNTDVRLQSVLGQLEVDTFGFADSTLMMDAAAAKISLKSVVASAARGVSPIIVNSLKGSVYLDTVQSSSISVKTTAGQVFGQKVQAPSNSYRLGNIFVATTSGKVSLTEVVIDGTMQVESHTGDITINLLPPADSIEAFKGSFALRNYGHGTIEIRQGVSTAARDGNQIRTLQQNADSWIGSVNCNDETCPYVGTLQLSILDKAAKGNIVVVIGCDKGVLWDAQCTASNDEGSGPTPLPAPSAEATPAPTATSGR
jgi:hypothetical protein